LHFGFEKPTPEIMEAWGKRFESIADTQACSTREDLRLLHIFVDADARPVKQEVSASQLAGGLDPTAGCRTQQQEATAPGISTFCRSSLVVKVTMLKAAI